jgi:hypothetical protein
MTSSILSATVLAGTLLGGLLCASMTTEADAQQQAAPPDFSSNQVGWIPIGGDFIEIPGTRPPLVRNDPAHPVRSQWHWRATHVPNFRSQQSEPEALGEGAYEEGQR